MKYSRMITMFLLGTDCFSEEEISNHRLSSTIKYHHPLDVFTILLFFFVYEPKFSPSRFLQYFCGIKKISDLKGGKEKFLEVLSVAFEQLSQIKISKEPFLIDYQRKNNNWKYTLSESALELQKLFFCDLEQGVFWIENQRMGISVAYMGAYIYLLGVLGKKEIDLSYLGKQKLVQLFDSGYDICGMRATIANLVRKFSNTGVFSYGKRLENLNDRVLHAKQSVPQGVSWHETKEYSIKRPVSRDMYYAGKWSRTERQCLDFEKILKKLQTTVNHLNDMRFDFRYTGKLLRSTYFLDYQTNRMDRLLTFRWAGSKIKSDNWLNITVGEYTACSAISIDYLRSLYLYSRLTIGSKGKDFDNLLTAGRSQTTIALIVEKAWEAMLKYPGNKPQQHLTFRKNIYKYALMKAKDDDIEQFFKFLTENYFNLQKNLSSSKHIPTESNFMTESIGIFLEAAEKNLHQYIPSIAGERILIVPAGKEAIALQNLANAYREWWGDIRRVKFKVSSWEKTDYFHFTSPVKFELVSEKWLPNCLIY